MSENEALATFRLALNLVKAKGIASESRDRVAMLCYQTDCLTINLTPMKDERPNGLEVWRRGATDTKVLEVSGEISKCRWL